MTALAWHEVGSRVYQNGLSHGVLFPPSGPAVPWNGLVSVEQEFDNTPEALWFDGMKLGDFIEPSDFKGTLKAITYPDEFESFIGSVDVNVGVAYDGQKAIPFGLTWQTRINNTEEQDIGYRIHIAWNVIAQPKSYLWQTTSDDASLEPFEWDISATPDEFLNLFDELGEFRAPETYAPFRPSAHVIIDSRDVDPHILDDLEAMLYGTESTDPSLPDGAEFYEFISNWALIRITDNLDGTWTASTASFNPEKIFELDPDEQLWQIDDANVEVLDADSYNISSTRTVDDIT